MPKVLLIFFWSFLLLFTACDSDDDGDKNGPDVNNETGTDNPLSNGRSIHSGKMIILPVTSGAPANVYQILNPVHTNKWLFIYPDVEGLNDNIKKESERLASVFKNINILAFDFSDGKTITDKGKSEISETLLPNEKRATEIINAAIKYAGDSCKITTLGWGYGGTLSLKTAIIAGDKDMGCVMFYGKPETEMAKIYKIKCPVLAIFAKNDATITQQMISDFETRMRSAIKPVIIKSFDADHGFANPNAVNYNSDPSADANKIMINFFRNRFSEK